MKKYPSDTADRFIVRLPEGWRDVMGREAKRSHRSMNAEFLAAIEAGMKAKGVLLNEAA